MALHDADRARAEALASELGDGVAVVDAPEAAFKDDEVEIAVIATTHDALAPLAAKAVEAGCHVLVEKPGADRAAALLALNEVAERHGRVVRVGFNHRFHPAVLKAKELVESGQYGQVLNLRARYGHGGRLGYEREWRADRALSGGGELLDQGVHLIDLTRFLAGEASLAFSELRTEFWDMSVEDNAYLALRTARGAFAWLHASWTEWKNLFSLEVAMRGAKIEVSGLGGSYGPECLLLHEMRPEMGPPRTSGWEWRDDDSWAREWEDVLLAIQGGPARGAGITDALAAMRIVEEAYAR